MHGQNRLPFATYGSIQRTEPVLYYSDEKEKHSMFRRTVLLGVVAMLAALINVPALLGQGSSDANPENSAAFVGDWTLATSEGLSVVIHIKVEDGKLAGTVEGNPLAGPITGFT